jgi:hypothetical protein
MVRSRKRFFQMGLACAVLTALVTASSHLLYGDRGGDGAGVLWLVQMGLAAATVLLVVAGFVVRGPRPSADGR